GHERSIRRRITRSRSRWVVESAQAHPSGAVWTPHPRPSRLSPDGAPMPKYVMLIVERESAYAEAGEAGFAESMAQHNAFAAEVAAAGGSILGGEALQPTATASYLRGTRTADVQTVDNPMPEVKEVIGGYYLVEAADDAAALELAKLCPAPYGHIEIRPVWEFNG